MGKNIKLTDNDTKNTLSSAKKKAKAPKTVLIKNVVEYWPVLPQEKIDEFIGILER
jgi:hypothetical protein